MAKKKQIAIPLNSLAQYVSIFNFLFELTKKELTVFVKILEIFIELRDKNIYVFTAPIRKRMADDLGLDRKQFNNYFLRLKKKSAIIERGGAYTINPLLIPSKESEILIQLRWNF